MTLFHLLIQSHLDEFWDENFHGVMTIDDYYLHLECMPAVSFNMSCDDYIGIFKKLMNFKSYAFNYFVKMAPTSFKTLIYSRQVLHSKLMLMDF